jgi:hypothetical protein
MVKITGRLRHPVVGTSSTLHQSMDQTRERRVVAQGHLICVRPSARCHGTATQGVQHQCWPWLTEVKASSWAKASAAATATAEYKLFKLLMGNFIISLVWL